jgi:ABC-type sugar transport system ATPase subunit
MTPNGPPVARLRGIQKTYGPVRVLNVDDLTLHPGEIVGLVGENGAGKSTMMGVLAGTVTADAGRIELGAQVVQTGHPAAAAVAGVAMVSQEFPLVRQLSVGENLLLGRRPDGARRGIVDWRRLHRQAQAVLDELGLAISSRQRLDSLSIAQRQLVEIAKAWERKPRLLILDEPTSALGPGEVGVVLDLARRHAAGGGAVLFVGHRLAEVLDVSHRLVVLRNGAVVADLPRVEADEERLVREMVGTELAADFTTRPPAGTRVVLDVSGLTADGLGPIDVRVSAGEVVGVAGLMGSGRSRLLHTIFGAQHRTAGEITLSGTRFAPRSPAEAIAAGVVLVPEDRKEQALLPNATVRWNTTLTSLPVLTAYGYLNPTVERRAAAGIVAAARVRCRSPEQPVRALSGGNQQRAVFGRAMATRPKLLLLDEPTRGVDVGAKAELYHLIDEASQTGCAVLLASSELEELMRICHRIVVMAGGAVRAVLDRAAFTKESIMTSAAAVPSAGHPATPPGAPPASSRHRTTQRARRVSDVRRDG